MPFPEHPLIMGKPGQCQALFQGGQLEPVGPQDMVVVVKQDAGSDSNTFERMPEDVSAWTKPGGDNGKRGWSLDAESQSCANTTEQVSQADLWLSWHLFKPPLQQGEETVPGDSKGQPLVLCPDLLSPLHLTLPLKAAAPLCHLSPSSRKGAGSSWLAAEEPGN